MALADLFSGGPDAPTFTISAEPALREEIARLEALLSEGVVETLAERREELVPADATLAADPFDRLRAAMEARQLVSFTYVRGYDGAQGRYVGEPYEMGAHPISGRPVLWVIPYSGSGAIPMHEHGGEIHAFRDDRVRWDTLTVVDEPFSPEWPVRPESVG